MHKMVNNLEASEELTPEERNLLGVAYKQVLTQKRSSWRVIDSIEAAVVDNARERQLTQDFKANIEVEIEELCELLIVS